MRKYILTTLLQLFALSLSAQITAETVPEHIEVNDSLRQSQAEIDSLLNHESVNLDDFVIKAKKAAVVTKQDTIEYNAGSYKVTPNATVEDLLKKLPGVEVGSDGTITSNGKSITKVLVDGKEFFGEDTKMATRNLPSDLVDKVQVVDKKSDFARLTGVDDGEDETVINLTVKKNMKNGWFGNFEAGYGTDNRYAGNFNVSTFTDNNQISIVGGANNINEQGFMDRGRGNFNSFGGSGGINESQRIGLNFNVGKSEKFRVGGNVYYSHSDRKALSRTDTQYLFPDSVSTKSAGNQSRDRGHNVYGDFRMQWNITENNSIDFRPNFSLNFRNAEMNDTSLLRAGDVLKTLVNRNDNSRFNDGTSWSAGGDLIFNHKFASHPGRSFSVRARYSFSNTRQYTTSWNDIEYYLQQDDSETLYQFIDGHQWNNSVNATLTWTEPLGELKRGNFLQISYRFQGQFNNSDKGTYDLPLPSDPDEFIPIGLDVIPVGGDYNADLSNNFRNELFTHELKIGYKKVANKMNLEAGMVFSPSSSRSTDLINSARNIPVNWVWNVAPYFRLRYRFSKTESLHVRYNARTRQASMSQLQPVKDVSNPLNIVIGNPDLKPTFTQSVNVHYNRYDNERQQALMAMLNADYSTNVIVSRTITDPNTGGRTTTYANANGNMNLFGMAMVNQPFRNRNWRFMARLGARYNSQAGYINGDFNRTGNLNLSPRAGITFNCDVFEMSLNPTYSFGMTTNTLPDQKDRFTHTYGFYTDATLTLPLGLTVGTDLSYDRSTGYSQGFDNDSWLWNASISYSTLRDKSLTFTVRAYDMLQMKKNVNRSISANQIVDSRYNDLTRYVMFSVSYTFNTMKSRKRGGDFGPDGPGRFGPPPGEGRGPMGPPPGGRH